MYFTRFNGEGDIIYHCGVPEYFGNPFKGYLSHFCYFLGRQSLSYPLSRLAYAGTPVLPR